MRKMKYLKGILSASLTVMFDKWEVNKHKGFSEEKNLFFPYFYNLILWNTNSQKKKKIEVFFTSIILTTLIKFFIH